MKSSSSSNTLITYQVIVKNIQTSPISQLRLRSITTEHLQTFMDDRLFAYTLTTFIIFVVPDLPIGTPEVMTTKSFSSSMPAFFPSSTA